MSTNYDELSARAERGDLSVKPETVRRGADATAEAQRSLVDATGARNLTRCVPPPPASFTEPGAGTP